MSTFFAILVILWLVVFAACLAVTVWVTFNPKG